MRQYLIDRMLEYFAERQRLRDGVDAYVKRMMEDHKTMCADYECSRAQSVSQPFGRSIKG